VRFEMLYSYTPVVEPAKHRVMVPSEPDRYPRCDGPYIIEKPRSRGRIYARARNADGSPQRRYCFDRRDKKSPLAPHNASNTVRDSYSTEKGRRQ